MSIVAIGSINPVKSKATKDALLSYPLFSDAEFIDKNVSSGVPEQPLWIREIWLGARNRALHSWDGNCDHSIVLESGLGKMPGEKLFRLNTTFCAIYDWIQFEYGQSRGFLIPERVAQLIFDQRIPLDEALKRSGITNEDRIG